jgi:hypothetical protein
VTTHRELAARAVACKHWRFLPGMRIVGHNTAGRPASMRLLDIPGSAWPEFWVAETRNAEEVRFLTGVRDSAFLPDLTDACTLGGVLDLVRSTSKTANPSAVCNVRGEWHMNPWHTAFPHASTEAECLVLALEMAQ